MAEFESWNDSLKLEALLYILLVVTRQSSIGVVLHTTHASHSSEAGNSAFYHDMATHWKRIVGKRLIIVALGINASIKQARKALAVRVKHSSVGFVVLKLIPPLAEHSFSPVDDKLAICCMIHLHSDICSIVQPASSGGEL
jgi:hypothetical protein